MKNWRCRGSWSGAKTGHVETVETPSEGMQNWVVATQIFFIFIPILGEMVQFDEYFSDGLVQPPTRKNWELNVSRKAWGIDLGMNTFSLGLCNFSGDQFTLDIYSLYIGSQNCPFIWGL